MKVKMDGRMSLLTSPFVPEGMVDLMKKLSKSIIKERPTNIYEFAADFFERMLIERDGSLDKGYGKFRSYTEYCKFMDKMEQRRLSQPHKNDDAIKTANIKDTAELLPEIDPPFNIEVQGVAIQGVERKSKDSSKDIVKNVSINPKYQSQSEKVIKPVVSNVSSSGKNVKTKPRKLSSKKPSENLIVIKEETSAEDEDNGSSEESNLHKAAATIQKAFRLYLSNKINHNVNVANGSGEVSQLSEDAAALIIQKAFKFLIQKMKSSTSNVETISRESNNNEVLAVAGQENSINSDKITNNNDENSEQILLEDTPDDTVTKQDLEVKENQLQDALDDTAITSEMKSKENQLVENVKDVTASDPVAQETDSNENQNEDYVSIESNNQVGITSHNNAESSTDQYDETAVELVVDSNKDKIEEVVPEKVPLIEELKSAENDVDETEKIELIANDRAESSSDFIKSNENQVENTSEDTSAYGTDSQVEFEPSHATDISDDTLSQPDAETKEDREVTGQLEQESENQVDNEVDDTASEQNQTTAFATTDTGTDLNPPLIADITETFVGSQIQDNQSQPDIASEESEMKFTLNTLTENVPEANADRSKVVQDTVDVSEVVEDKVDVSEVVEQTEVKELFLVENDGVYVNLDVLQDKLGQITIDDGAGSDSEKSFKLNILEREEILVNQENIQQMDDQLVRSKEGAVDNNNEKEDSVVTLKDKYFEEMDNPENKTDLEGKEEEGNEEYELAETVVLVDCPLRRNSRDKIQNSVPITLDTDESSPSDVMKTNDNIAGENKISVTTDEPLKHESSKVAQEIQSNNEINESEPNTDLKNCSEPVIKMNPLDSTTNINHQVTENTAEDTPTTTEVETKHENIAEQEVQQNNNDDIIVVDPVNADETTPEYVEIQPGDIDKQDEVGSESKIREEIIIVDKTSQEDQNGIQVEKVKAETQQTKDDTEVISSVEIVEAVEKYPDEQLISSEEVNGEIQQIKDETEVISSVEIVEAVEKYPDKQVIRSEEVNGEIQQTMDETEVISSVEIVEAVEKYPDKQLIRSEEVNREIQQTKDETEVFSSVEIVEGGEKYPDEQLIRSEENEKLVKAATVIQKVFRGYIVRRSAPMKIKNDNNELQLSAALIIQKYARGYLARRYLQKTKNFNLIQVTSNDTKDPENTELVPQLPAYSNRFLIPKDSFLERESFADDEDYARTCKELAATSIQKTYRGYRVRRALKPSSDSTDDVAIETNGGEEITDHQNEIEFSNGENEVHTIVTEADQVISEVLCVATNVLPLTHDPDTVDEVLEDKNIEQSSLDTQEKSSVVETCADKPLAERESVLGQLIHDNIHVEGQMQQKYNQMAFQDNAINPIEEMSDSSEQPDTPRLQSTQSTVAAQESVDSKFDGIKSFSYEQLSSDLSDTEENKRESLKESEVDETSRDDLSEVENFDLSSCGEDSLEAMYYSLRKNEIMLDRMQKQVTEQRESKSGEMECVVSENLKAEFPERVTENLDAAMNQVFKSMESSSDWDVGGKDEDDSSTTLDLGLDDSSSINDEKEIETSRHVKQLEVNFQIDEDSESTIDAKHNENNGRLSQSSESNVAKDMELNADQSQQSDSSINSSTRFIMKSQSVSEDMMNPIMFAMKRKQALLDQMHVRPYPLQENLSEDHDAFPEHLLSDIDIGNIQRKIFASSVSETDSDYIEYIEPNTTSRRLVRDDFNISTALDHLSTDSDSTIVSAATKIQAGARGFLTRRRLRRTSAGGTSISFEKRYSFGNAAIDKSLEDLIKRQEEINLDGAALKIQQQYRRYQARKKNLKKVSPIREQTLELSGGSSVEGFDEDNIGITEITMAQKEIDLHPDERNVGHYQTSKNQHIRLNIDEVDTVQPVKTTPVNQRRLTLQRENAVQRNSRPDSPDLNANVKDMNDSSTDNPGNEKFKDSETGEHNGSIINKQEKTVTPYINIQSLINRGIGPRQRSMPVQIDSELMRIIPKHLRKRVKSADIPKKKKY